MYLERGQLHHGMGHNLMLRDRLMKEGALGAMVHVGRHADPQFGVPAHR